MADDVSEAFAFDYDHWGVLSVTVRFTMPTKCSAFK